MQENPPFDMDKKSKKHKFNKTLIYFNVGRVR